MDQEYAFGVEIELIVKPRDIIYPLSRPYYYKKLASKLKHYGLDAVGDKLNERYRKHPEHYNKWWITKDGSLGDPGSRRGRLTTTYKFYPILSFPRLLTPCSSSRSGFPYSLYRR